MRTPSFRLVPSRLFFTLPFFTQLFSPFQFYSNFSWGHFSPQSFLFYSCIFAEGQVLPSSQGFTLYFCFLIDPLRGVPFSYVQNFSVIRSHLHFTRMILFLSITNVTKLKCLLLSGQSCPHRLPLLLPCPSFL